MFFEYVTIVTAVAVLALRFALWPVTAFGQDAAARTK
jgi:hypothetical protein